MSAALTPVAGEIVERGSALVLAAEAAYVTETSTGLIFHPDTPIGIWGTIVSRLQRQHERIEWAIGDAINFGETSYPGMYDQWVEQTGLAENTLATIRWVAERIERSRRREDIGWSHHREVAALPPEKQDELLSRAADEGMTRWDVRQAAKVEQERLRGRAVTPEGEPIETAELPWHATIDDLTDEARAALIAYAPQGRFRTAWIAGYMRALQWAGNRDCFLPDRWRD